MKDDEENLLRKRGKRGGVLVHLSTLCLGLMSMTEHCWWAERLLCMSHVMESTLYTCIHALRERKGMQDRPLTSLIHSSADDGYQTQDRSHQKQPGGRGAGGGGGRGKGRGRRGGEEEEDQRRGRRKRRTRGVGRVYSRDEAETVREPHINMNPQLVLAADISDITERIKRSHNSRS